MGKKILMDQFHLSVFAPRGLRTAEYDAIHRTLGEARFHIQLRRAVRQVIRQRPALKNVRVVVSR